MNRPQLIAIANAIQAIRPDWQQPGILTALGQLDTAWTQTDAQLATHAIAIAGRPDSRTPQAINAAPAPSAAAARHQPLDEIRIRNQAIRGCTLCDPMGYLPTGHLCHHNPEQTESPERAAAKARARQAAEQARAKSKWKPKPEPDQRRVQEPWPEETPADD